MKVIRKAPWSKFLYTTQLTVRRPASLNPVVIAVYNRTGERKDIEDAARTVEMTAGGMCMLLS